MKAARPQSGPRRDRGPGKYSRPRNLARVVRWEAPSRQGLVSNLGVGKYFVGSEDVTRTSSESQYGALQAACSPREPQRGCSTTPGCGLSQGAAGRAKRASAFAVGLAGPDDQDALQPHVVHTICAGLPSLPIVLGPTTTCVLCMA